MSGGGIIHGPQSKNEGTIVLYALSTCVWCKKTKQLLNELGVHYRIIEVDLLEGATRDQVEDEVLKYNPMGTFPTLVISPQKIIAGYREEEIRKAFIK
jgi:glutaredoxin